jgi:DNA-binding PadR family transcriptional regulator
MSTHGLLAPLVVRQLKEGPQSGYSLVKGIQQSTGWKPSFGSIYPLLEKMQRNKLLTVKAQGRSKVYSLTAAGKAHYSEQEEKQSQAYEAIIEQLRILGSLGDEHATASIPILRSVQRGEVPFKEIPETGLVRNEMLRLLNEQKLKKHQKKLRSLYARMHEELKKL